MSLLATYLILGLMVAAWLTRAGRLYLQHSTRRSLEDEEARHLYTQALATYLEKTEGEDPALFVGMPALKNWKELRRLVAEDVTHKDPFGNYGALSRECASWIEAWGLLP